MAVPDNRLMDIIAAQGAQVPDAGGAPDDSAPPMGSPMMTPEPKMGNKEAAMINVGLALDLLEQSLPALGSESQEGVKVMAALRTLTGLMQPRSAKTNELKNAEILQLLQNLPQAGGGSPEGRAMMGAPPIPGMAQGAGAPPMPPPGGAPPPGAMPPPPGVGGPMPM